MKKFFIQITTCLLLLLCIPFSSFAETSSPFWISGERRMLSDEQYNYLNTNFTSFNSDNSIILFDTQYSDLYLSNHITVSNKLTSGEKVTGTFTKVSQTGTTTTIDDYFTLGAFNGNTRYSVFSYIDNSEIRVNICTDTDLNINYCKDNCSLTLTSDPTNGGNTVGSGTYNKGSSITISATPNEGYKFDNWSDGNTENPRSLTINTDMSLTANFSQINISDNAIIYQVINTIDSIECNYSNTIGGKDYYRTTLNYIEETRFIGDFDVYVKYNDVYKPLLTNIHSFSLFTNKQKKSSDTLTACPVAPNIPQNTYTVYEYDLTYGNYLFKHHDNNSNNIIVTAPDTDKLISDGNSNSQSATSNNNQSNQLLDNTVNQMDQLENNYKSDLNNNLNNINANDFNISGITQLSNAANFVRIQFDNLTKNNPFGIILGFSLFIGLSLLIIGKRL